LPIESVANALSSAGGEILGGTWVLLVSWAALRGRLLSKALNYFGAVVGAIGILSAIPFIGVMGTVIFGLVKMELQNRTTSQSSGSGISCLPQYSDCYM